MVVVSLFVCLLFSLDHWPSALSLSSFFSLRLFCFIHTEFRVEESKIVEEKKK